MSDEIKVYASGEIEPGTELVLKAEYDKLQAKLKELEEKFDESFTSEYGVSWVKGPGENPAEGFVAEFNCMKAKLQDAVETLQFALTYNPDVDHYKIKHTAYPKLKACLERLKKV